MLRFMVQVLQDPPFCSSTVVSCLGGMVAILVANVRNQLMFGRVGWGGGGGERVGFGCGGGCYAHV
jgi:hypothetical protein